MNIVFKSDGLYAYEEDGKYFLKYDTGDHIGTIETIEITIDELNQLKTGSKGIYDVIIKHQNIAMGLIKE